MRTILAALLLTAMGCMPEATTTTLHIQEDTDGTVLVTLRGYTARMPAQGAHNMVHVFAQAQLVAEGYGAIDIADLLDCPTPPMVTLLVPGAADDVPDDIGLVVQFGDPADSDPIEPFEAHGEYHP